MFSGIIEDKAVVKKVIKNPGGVKIAIESQKVSQDATIGDSISVNGVCLTVVDVDKKTLQFDVMSETLRATTISELKIGDIVNAERSLKMGDRISGHFVTGHIDCIGIISSVKKEPNDYTMEIKVPAEKALYLAGKGSVAVDGISLTIAGNRSGYFKISLIPLTLKMTSLESKKNGDKVNIEFDILAKYAMRNSGHSASKIDSEFLRRHGFA
ncbi:MAG: riboflavin synthase [Candidatus Omnitrophica bacterium]|nr:riboflavin synthase [Candidatus Omnitrophota bacterium]